jgi:hypothetical protein
MKTNELHISRLCAWAPGVENPREWDEWSRQKRDINCVAESPSISFTSSIFRRRLSQISKMTIQVIHDLLPFNNDAKLFFLSFRGELTRQFQINKMLIQDNSLMPAAFSLSVFNAPVALATIALKLKGGYTALYPASNSFAAGLIAARAALMCGDCDEMVFAYADEQAPPEYKGLYQESPPLAFGLLLTRKPGDNQVPLLQPDNDDSPHDYLRKLLVNGGIHVSA